LSSIRITWPSQPFLLLIYIYKLYNKMHGTSVKNVVLCYVCWCSYSVALLCMEFWLSTFKFACHVSVHNNIIVR
jgi:hypothetical protein